MKIEIRKKISKIYFWDMGHNFASHIRWLVSARIKESFLRRFQIIIKDGIKSKI